MGQKNCFNTAHLDFDQFENEFTQLNQETKSNKTDVVIGIDFGTSGIGCAYGFFENEHEPIGVYFNGQADKN